MKRLSNEVDKDIAENFSKEVIILSSFGVFRGHTGVKMCSEKLSRDIEGAVFAYNHTQIEGDYAFLEWTATLPSKEVRDGADSFVTQNGKIIMQTIHYTVGK